jgi:hypothetical protein
MMTIFHLKKDSTGKLCFTYYQEFTTALMMLAYGVVGDLVDEYIHMSEYTLL